jgi:hypothetical protein
VEGREGVVTDELDWRVAIIGYDPIVLANYLDAYGRGKPKPPMDNGQRKTHLAQYIDDESLRPLFYQALLAIEWLPSRIQSAVMSELGLSLKKQKIAVEKARTTTLKFLVDEVKGRMRRDSMRPRGGIHEAAVAEVAARQNVTPDALKKRITRLGSRKKRKRVLP